MNEASTNGQSRRIVVNTFLSLDGVMQAPGDSEEDRRDGFDQGGWQMPYFDEVAGTAMVEAMEKSGGMLIGRRTYEIFAGYWPHETDENPFAETMNSLPKYVVSNTLSEATWANSTLISEDVADQIAQLKQQPGNDLYVIGSGDLIQTLMKHDLIDQYVLWIHPIVLGDGHRLFRNGTPPTSLSLVESRQTTTGVMILTYEPAA